MPQVKIPPPYRGPTRGRDAVEVEGERVGACLEDLCRRYPDFRPQLFDGAGAVQRFVTLFVNGDEIARDALDTPVGADDQVEILAAIAGG